MHKKIAALATMLMLCAAPAMAHFQLLYTPESALEKGQEIPLKVVFTHPFEAGHTMEVFSQPHLDQVYAGYEEVSALAAGWRERVGAHQLHMLIIHAALFGGGYGAQTVATARRYA